MDIDHLVSKDPRKLRKAQYTVSIIPWFMGLSNDLMFYMAINTLFFAEAKGMSAAEITFLTTVSGTVCILLQPLALAFIHKIGNTRAVRLGTLLLLAGSIFLTFAPSYPFVIAGHILYSFSFLFKTMDNVVLQSDLDYLGQHDGYILQKNKAGILYSAVTTVVALLAGPLFKVDAYLPMYCCIGVCVLNVVLAFTFSDVDERPRPKKEKEKKKGTFGKLVLFIILAYGIVYALIAISQSNVKLLLQYQLSDFFDVGTTATLFSVILVLSRVARILSNLLFYRIYRRCKNKVAFLIPSACALALITAAVGCFVPLLPVKFTLITVGFCLILGIRDLYSTYMNNLAMQKTSSEEHQSVISYMQFARKVGDTLLSFIVSLLLLRLEMIWVVGVLFLIALASVIMNIKLYQKSGR